MTQMRQSKSSTARGSGRRPRLIEPSGCAVHEETGHRGAGGGQAEPVTRRARSPSCRSSKRRRARGTPRARRLSSSRVIVSCSDAATLRAGGRTTAATRAATAAAVSDDAAAAPAVRSLASAAPRTHARTGGESPGRMQTSLLLSLIEVDGFGVRLQRNRTLMCPSLRGRGVVPRPRVGDPIRGAGGLRRKETRHAARP